MKISPAQLKALRTIDANPGTVVYGQRTASTKNFLRINGNTENSLERLKIAAPRVLRTETIKVDGMDTTYEMKVWELTDSGRKILADLDAPAEQPAPPVAVPAEVADRPMPQPVTPATLAEAKNVTPAELATMTAPQIDAMNVALDREFERIETAIERAWATLYSRVGVRKESVRRGRGYTQQYVLTRTELVERAHALVDGGPIDPETLRGSPMLASPARRAAYDANIRAVLTEMDNLNAALRDLKTGPVAKLDGEFDRRGGWTRFLLCTNADGHIHRDRSCGSIHYTTLLARLPELSGLTEADAVRAHGTVLCSHCYRSAPVEWTVGNPKPAKAGECSGSRQYADPKTYNPRHMSRYAPCANAECTDRPSVTPSGFLRAHTFKPAAA